jgi:AcrR family transcriptional regulator
MATSAPDQLTPAAREIVTTARKLLKEQGIEALSMRRIGQRLGVRAPSIHKHRGGSLLVPDGPSER